jgi:hypothetical protein
MPASTIFCVICPMVTVQVFGEVEQSIPCTLASQVSVPMTIDDRNDYQQIDRKGLSQ